MHMFVTIRAAIIAGCIVGVVGCGPDTHTISGRAHFRDGKPLAAGNVDIEQQNGNFGASAPLAVDGSFTLPNLPAGEYAVSFSQAFIPGITPDPTTGDKGRAPSGLLIHQRFLKPETSGLKVTVPVAGAVDFVVEQ
ncbi:MAG: hypothetical protein LC104_17300 [Bacteroidales bacterium]|nr:hypothetical protein [Bacteroidales bacterium]